MMKTSVIEVHDMLSVFSVEEVEQRIGEVRGVDSVTVNYAAGSATVRFDETRLEVSDIKAGVRQQGYTSTAPAAASTDAGHADHTATPGPAPPARAPVAPATAGVAAADASQQDKAAPSTAPVASAAAPTLPSAAPAADGQQDETAPNKA